jgi:hypothetical protein
LPSALLWLKVLLVTVTAVDRVEDAALFGRAVAVEGGVYDGHHAARSLDHAAAAAFGVLGLDVGMVVIEGAVCDVERAAPVLDGAAARGAVVGKGAVVDNDGPAVDDGPAPSAIGHVLDDGAVLHDERARVVDGAAAA